MKILLPKKKKKKGARTKQMVLLILPGLIKISKNPHPASFCGLVNYQYCVGMISLLVFDILRASNIRLKDIFCYIYTGKTIYL